MTLYVYDLLILRIYEKHHAVGFISFSMRSCYIWPYSTQTQLYFFFILSKVLGHLSIGDNSAGLLRKVTGSASWSPIFFSFAVILTFHQSNVPGFDDFLSFHNSLLSENESGVVEGRDVLPLQQGLPAEKMALCQCDQDLAPGGWVRLSKKEVQCLIRSWENTRNKLGLPHNVTKLETLQADL